MASPRLLFTIDVEEDMPGWQIKTPTSVDNASALPRLAELCTELGVRPTYLCTYPMVTEPSSSRILRALVDEGGCEIGTHLHPWNTPPFQGVPNIAGDERQVPYYQYQLGPDRFRAKLEVLHAAVTDVAGYNPTSFRAGRFGIDAATLAELPPFGYQVDSSVTPLEEHLADGGPDFRSAPLEPYRPSARNITRRGNLPILEVPVSVALTKNWPIWMRRAFVRLPKWTRLRGMLSSDFMGLVDFAWLYPARFDLDVMRRATDALIADGQPVLNVFIHSSELVPAASGRIRTQEDAEACFAAIRGLLEYCISEHAAVPATLSEVGPGLRTWLDFDESAA